MLDTNKTVELLRDNPDYVEILYKAVGIEEELKENAFVFSWDVNGGPFISMEKHNEIKKLKDYLYNQFYELWIKDAVVNVTNSGTDIRVQGKSDHCIAIDCNDTFTNAIAQINDNTGRTYQFDVEKDDDNTISLYKFHWAEWEWSDVQAATGSINKMIREGIVKIAYKTNKRTEYALVDLEETKLILDQIKFDQDAEEYGIEPQKVEEIHIPDDAFDIIVGYDDVKGIISKGLQSDKPVNFLFIGAPGTAKSMFLEELNRIPGSSYHLGSSSTKAGLNEFLFDVQPRILLIDEIEKMDSKDYAVLLSLMEGGKVVETKKNRRRELTLNTMVFAACNTTRKIPPENMSRFHFKFVFQQYTHAEFEDVVQRILVTREGVDPVLAGYIAGKMSDVTKDVREAVGIARVCKTTEDVDQVIEIKYKYIKGMM